MIRKRTPLEREVDEELIAKGKDVVKDFDESKAFFVPAKKQRRPRRPAPPGLKRVREWIRSIWSNL